MTDQTDRDRIITALYDARRHGLGGMSEAQAVGHMADAVLAALPAVSSAGPAPATDRDTLRERIAEALLDHLSRTADIRPGRNGDPAFMPEITDGERMRIAGHLAAVLPAPTDRAAMLEEVADRLERKASALTVGLHDLAIFVAKARLAEAEILDREAAELRRRAGETQQDEARGVTCPHGCDTTHCPCLACEAETPAREAQQDPTQDGEAPCRNPGHRAHPGFTCAEVDQTRPFWEGRWADAAVARPGQPETDNETLGRVECGMSSGRDWWCQLQPGHSGDCIPRRGGPVAGTAQQPKEA